VREHGFDACGNSACSSSSSRSTVAQLFRAVGDERLRRRRATRNHRRRQRHRRRGESKRLMLLLLLLLGLRLRFLLLLQLQLFPQRLSSSSSGRLIMTHMPPSRSSLPSLPLPLPSPPFLEKLRRQRPSSCSSSSPTPSFLTTCLPVNFQPFSLPVPFRGLPPGLLLLLFVARTKHMHPPPSILRRPRLITLAIMLTNMLPSHQILLTPPTALLRWCSRRGRAGGKRRRRSSSDRRAT